jgi:tRNA threonylcarbamoyladenosine biosynthesis protein TsaE
VDPPAGPAPARAGAAPGVPDAALSSEEPLRYESAGPACTEALGAGLAALLGPGDLILLVGDLGAGKTTLVRAAARALGIAGPVTSPTFAIAQRYEGRVPLAHLDAYRLTGPDDEELGLALEAIGEGAVAFVEWPDSLLGALPPPRLRVDLLHSGAESRLILLNPQDLTLVTPLRRLVADLRARHRHPQPRPRGRPG